MPRHTLEETDRAAHQVESAGDPGKKLVILCLHGFRQNAKQFKVCGNMAQHTLTIRHAGASCYFENWQMC